MSVSGFTDKIKEAQNELERVTGVTEVEKPDGTVEMVAGEFSCERLQAQIDQYMKEITDSISAHTEMISALMSQYAPILQIPSDPLKIIKWAKKVVTGMVDPAISAAIELAIDIAQLAGALAGLASAVAQAVARLADCVQRAVLGALETIRDSVMQNAMKLYDQAFAMYENIRDGALDQLGYSELLELKSEVSTEIDTLMGEIGSIETSIDQIGESADTLNNLQIPLTS